MKIYLVCGETASGKSTFVRTMSNRGYATFHSSAVFNKLKEEIDLSKCKDLESPAELDIHIRDAMYRFLRSASNECVVFIETVPRSLDSLEWVRSLVEQYGKNNVTAIWFSAPKEERENRMKDRLADREEFDKKRMKQENAEKHMKLIYGLCQILGERRFNFHDGTEDIEKYADAIEFRLGMESEFDPSLKEKTPIQKRYTSATNVYYERCGYMHERPHFERMIERVKNELDELADVKKQQSVNQHDIESEFADVMHFVYCLADACGISADDMERVFHEKTKINQARLQFPEADKHKLNGNLIGEIMDNGDN